MTKKKKIILIVLIVLLVCLGIVGFLYIKSNKTKTPNQTSLKTVDQIKDYGYSIKENDSKVKRKKFEELKSILSEDTIDYDNYASKMAEVFVIDVYDLDSKVNKYDVGGLEYVLDENRETFKLKLQDTLYSNIMDNIAKDRKQELPIVKDATASDLKQDSFTLNNNSYDSYSVKVRIDYEKDLGYDSVVSITMIKRDSKLFVVVVEPI